METSIFNGSNLGKLQFSHYVTIRFYKRKGFAFYQKQFEMFFNAVKHINSIYYTLEKSKIFNDYHLHGLINTIDYNEIHKNVHVFFQSKISKSTEREILIKNEKTPVIKEGVYLFQDQIINTASLEIYGKIGFIFIEKILGAKNVAYYINKYSGRGITTGYLEKRIKTQ